MKSNLTHPQIQPYIRIAGMYQFIFNAVQVFSWMLLLFFDCFETNYIKFSMPILTIACKCADNLR